MSQTTHRVIDVGNNPDGYHSQSQSTQNPPLQGESNFGDSSAPFFSLYSKIAEDEDNKMVERWQKDADGILIFTGLFSAAVAALLALTVPDLRPNSQDTSAFYLGNIYGVLADPNYESQLCTLGDIVSSMGASVYPSYSAARCSPEKRARMREFFANGVDKMHVPWAVEGLPTLLHLSLFLFFGGLGIFLFNVDQEVFTFVSIQHPAISSNLVLCTRIPHVTIHLLTATVSLIIAYILVPVYLLAILIFRVLFFFFTTNQLANQIQSYWERFWRYSNQIAKYLLYWMWETERPWSSWLLMGLEKKVEETASKRPTKLDARIFGWTISALGDDDSLETFFETIPGLFNSNLVKNIEGDITWTHLKTFWGALDGFMRRTLSSNSVTESVKSRRVLICRDIIGVIPCPDISIHDDLRSHFDQGPVSIARLQSMTQWFTHKDHNIADYARVEVARSLASLQERDDAWIAFASDMCGLAADDLRDDIAHGGDNACRGSYRIRHTSYLPRLQNDFCKLWNEFAEEAKVQGYPGNIPVSILRLIRHLYIALHQGTDSAPTIFSSSTDDSDNILRLPLSYPSCNIANHHPGSTAYVPVPDSRNDPMSTHPGNSPDASPYYITSGESTVSRHLTESSITAGPPSPSHPTTPYEIGTTLGLPLPLK
ncbi:hypothetical protein BJV77DRAFT_1161235 [Russula vinacea]|nr:hypothetical protein BJV77DRAFT_1161235 [Russula vinacea]